MGRSYVALLLVVAASGGRQRLIPSAYVAPVRPAAPPLRPAAIGGVAVQRPIAGGAVGASRQRAASGHWPWLRATEVDVDSYDKELQRFAEERFAEGQERFEKAQQDEAGALRKLADAEAAMAAAEAAAAAHSRELDADAETLNSALGTEQTDSEAESLRAELAAAKAEFVAAAKEELARSGGIAEVTDHHTDAEILDFDVPGIDHTETDITQVFDVALGNSLKFDKKKRLNIDISSGTMDLGVILRLVDIAQYRLAMESANDAALDARRIRVGAKYRRLRDIAEDTVRDIRTTAQSYKKLLKLVLLRMDVMPAAKAWQNNQKAMADELDPLAGQVRRCAGYVEVVLSEARSLSSSVSEQIGNGTSTSSELRLALDRIALLGNGLGRLVAEFYDALAEGVQKCGRESTKNLKGELTESWRQWREADLDGDERAASQEKMRAVVFRSMRPFEHVEKLCDEFLEISTRDPTSVLPQRSLRAVRNWVSRSLPHGPMQGLNVVPDNFRPLISLRHFRMRLRRLLRTAKPAVLSRFKRLFVRKYVARPAGYVAE